MVSISVELLDRSPTSIRRDIAEDMFRRIAGGDVVVQGNFTSIARLVVRELEGDKSAAFELTKHPPQGIFAAKDTLGILPGERTRGFVRSILRQPVNEGAAIVDAGTGAAALLASAAAVANPNNRVVAIEYNPLSVKCAQRMVGLFGLDNIEVVEGDVFEAELPSNIGLGITETFHRGLMFERGAEIAHHMAANGAQRILPRKATVLGRVSAHVCGNNIDGLWNKMQEVDFRDENAQVSGILPNDLPGGGLRSVSVRAYYYDEYDEVIVAGYMTDHITMPQTLGRVNTAVNTRSIAVSYTPGVRFVLGATKLVPVEY